METIITGISTVTDAIGTVFTAMTSNAYIVFFLSASVLGTGIGMFRKLRRAA